MAFQPNFRMVRADDQLVLDVALEGMTVAGSPTGGRVQQLGLSSPSSAGRITLTFQPQQVLEYARDAQGVRLFQPRPIFAPPTTVVLTVPALTPPVPATVAGVLGLARRLALVTDDRAGTVTATTAAVARSGAAVTTAAPPRLPAARGIAATRAAATGGPVDAGEIRRRQADLARRRPAPPVLRRGVAPASTGAATTAEPGTEATPTSTDTSTTTTTGAAAATGPSSAFAFPYLLTVRPPGGDTRLDHPTGPVRNGDHTALWTTALGVTDGQRTVETDLDVLFGVSKDSQTKTCEWIQVVDDSKLDNSIKRSTAKQLADRTDPPGGGAVDPATLRRLRLSALGGWLDVDGEWRNPLLKFQHSIAMGRDQGQLVVQEGFLYPFNFKATATSQSERVIEKGGTRVAALHTVSSIRVDDPVAIFGDFTQQPDWPYREITCRTTETGPGTLDPAKNPPGTGTETVPGALIFTVRDRPFEFRMTALDRTGNEVEFHLPLIFVPPPTPNQPGTGIDHPALPALWAAQGGAFTDLRLGGQPHGMAPATPADEAADRADPADRAAARSRALADDAADPPPTPAQATTVLANTLKIAIKNGKPSMTHVTGIVPALDRALPGTELALKYTDAYVKAQFNDALNGVVNTGRSFLEPLAKPVVEVGNEAAQGLQSVTGSLSQVSLPIAALSRTYGAVAGAAADIAKGDLDINSIVGAADRLLGVVPLRSLFKGDTPKIKIKDPTDGLPGNYRLTVDVQDGIATQDLTVSFGLFGDEDDKEFVDIPPGGFARLQPLRPPDDPAAKNLAKLTIFQHTETDLDGNVRSRTQTIVEKVELEVRFQNRAVVTVPFEKASFTSVDGKKPDPDIELGKIRFGGILELLARLAELVDTKGFNDPPAVEVTPTGVVSGFSIAVPAVAIGMFSLENISFGAALALSFTGEPIRLDLTFATPDNPFRVCVAMLGGGGSIAVGLSSNGLESVAGMLEFGASISVDLVIARASAEVMGGVSFLYRRDPVFGELSAYLRIHGEVDILSLISICVDLLLTLTYQFEGADAGKLVGEASVAVEIKTIFFSETVTARARQKFAGSNGDPTFVELMAPPGTPGTPPWDLYCSAFTKD